MSLEPLEFLRVMLRRIELDDADKRLLQENVEWGKQIAPSMADIFYSYLGKDEEMSKILNASEGRIHRLRETFVKWFGEMFTGIDNWDKAYAECRWHIGVVHGRLGIGPQHVVPAMAVVVNAVQKALRSEGKSSELADALSKICMVDLAFIERAYFEVASQALLKETGWSEGLFKKLIATGVTNL